MEQQKKSRFSKVKVGLAAVALGALLVVPASANDRTEEVTFEISGGAFTMDLTDGQMADVETYGMNMSTTGSVELLVSDLRGTDGEWTVSLEATDFANDDETASTPASGLSVTGDDGVNSDGGTGTVDTETPSDLSEASLLATGNGAHGDHSWTPELALDIEDGTPAGIYSSTLTVTTNVAP